MALLLKYIFLKITKKWKWFDTGKHCQLFKC